MRRMKYVLNSESGHFVLIPDIGMNHSCINGKWTSAGFINFIHEKDDCGNIITKAECFGKSVSLDLKSGDKDSEIISRSLRDEGL